MSQALPTDIVDLDALNSVVGGEPGLLGLRVNNRFANKGQLATYNKCVERVEQMDLYKPSTWTLQTHKSCYATLYDAVAKNQEIDK